MTYRIMITVAAAMMLGVCANAAEIKAVEPAEGAVMPLLTDAQKVYLDMSNDSRREKFVDAKFRIKEMGHPAEQVPGEKKAREVYWPKTVRLAWEPVDGVDEYKVTVKDAKSGAIVIDQSVKDTSVNQAVVEKIYFDSQKVSQYYFRRLKGAWMLVEVRSIPFAKSNNASFLPFYHQFASSSEFQLQHLGNEVIFVGPDPDDDFATMEGVITPDTWEAFAPQLPKKMIYNIIYGEPRKEGNSKLFVLRGIANGMELEMTFQRSNGNWRLTKLST